MVSQEHDRGNPVVAELRGGDQYNGAPYVYGGGKWNPFNWSEPGTDCSGYVAKTWQVRVVREVTTQWHDVSTATLACGPGPWSAVERQNSQMGDAFTNDLSCIGGGSVHTFLYGWGPPFGTFAVYEATGSPYNRVVHRSRTADGTWLVVRRQSLQEPGIVGKRDDGSYSGATHQPIIDAYNRNGGRGSVGYPRYNGGGFLVHRWGNGNIQDMTGGSVGNGGLMQGDYNPGAAYYVYGGIWNHYVSIGGATSYLGYPQSDQYSYGNGARQDFQGGYIIWDNGCACARDYHW